jgi:hypothetical protein
MDPKVLRAALLRVRERHVDRKCLEQRRKAVLGRLEYELSGLEIA